MAFGSVQLNPGVNFERTPTVLRASYASSMLIRFKDGLAQKLGGWVKFFNLVIAGVPRDLHVWEDLNTLQHLFIGTTQGAFVLTNGSLQNITPQQFISDFAPNFSTIMGSPTVTVTDPNVTNVTVNDAVFFNTPVSIGGLILFGVFQIIEVTGTHSYQIMAAAPAPSSASNAGTVPQFTTVSGSAIITVLLANHGLSVGGIIVLTIPTTVGGIVVQGQYTVISVVDANNFTISGNMQASSNDTEFMNGGNAELVYYIAVGPAPAGTGYGLGGYGLGGYGLGVGGGGGPQTGTPIMATDWTSANWGEIILATPQGGGLYQWDPTSGFANFQLVSTAPTFAGGMFVSTTEQIAVMWGSSFSQNIGVEPDPLFVQWSTVGDFTNFNPTAADQAGGYRIPLGSKIQCGMATPNQNLLWTDLDCWAMNYQGPPFVFGFNQIGAGAGAVSSHAAMQLRGNVFWMGFSNFYYMAGGAVNVLPCPVWDFVFQNLNTAFQQNVRAMPNTNFNEAGWLFPSNASVSGENDCYVKFNILDPSAPWDFGPSNALPRSAWTDLSILGPPLGASPAGVIFQHETSNDADGTALNASFTTGYFYLAEGEDFVYVDQILPDFKWGFFGAPQTAIVQMTFNVVNYPGDTPEVFGPFSVTQATEFISVRFRGRQMSITVASTDLGSFWRLGYVRYRYKAMGRR